MKQATAVNARQGASKRSYPVIPPVLALLYAWLMLVIPWEDITEQRFVDREVYLEHFEYGFPVIEEKSIESLHEFFVNEALWDVVVRWLSDVTGIFPGTVLSGVSFLCFFVFSKWLLERFHPVYCAVFLFNPILIDFGISQLRMALAASLLLIALESKRTWRKALLALSAIFLHTASTIFIAIYVAANWLTNLVIKHKLKGALAVVCLIAFGFAIVLAIGPARADILHYVGDRRMEYETGSSSLLYGSFWVIFLVFQIVQPRQYFLNVVNSYSLTIISIFIFSIIFGVYGSRFIAASFPLLAFSMLSVMRLHKPFLLVPFIGYEMMQWYYWTMQN